MNSYQLDVPIFVQHEVVRLHVAVTDFSHLHVVEQSDDLSRIGSRHLQTQLTSFGAQFEQIAVG